MQIVVPEDNLKAAETAVKPRTINTTSVNYSTQNPSAKKAAHICVSKSIETHINSDFFATKRQN